MFQPKAHTTPSTAARAEKSMPLEQQAETFLHQSIRYQAGGRIQCKVGTAATDDDAYIGSKEHDADIHKPLLLLPK